MTHCDVMGVLNKMYYKTEAHILNILLFSNNGVTNYFFTLCRSFYELNRKVSLKVNPIKREIR